MPRTLVLRFLFVLCLFLLSPGAALAEVKIAVVDFQHALTQIDEGATATARLEGMQAEKMRNIEAQRQELTALQTELRNQSAILSEAALASKQADFEQRAMAFQQAAMQAEQELQAAYMGMMEEFFEKLSAVAEEIGKERGFNLVLEATESGIVFHQGVEDITDELVKRYNTRHTIK